MRRLTAAILVLLALAALGPGLSARHGDKLDEPRDDRQSLLFGFIDMDREGPDLEWASLQQAAPLIKEPLREMRVDPDMDGFFYLENVPPGSHQLHAFGGGNYFAGHAGYAMRLHDRNATAVRIDKPGLYYLGTYRFDVSWERDGMRRVGAWDLKPRAYPGEAQLLKKLLPRATGTKWEPLMKARIDALANPPPSPPASAPVPPLQIILPEPGK
jgi:hypothetical protein